MGVPSEVTEVDLEGSPCPCEDALSVCGYRQGEWARFCEFSTQESQLCSCWLSVAWNMSLFLLCFKPQQVCAVFSLLSTCEAGGWTHLECPQTTLQAACQANTFKESEVKLGVKENIRIAGVIWMRCGRSTFFLSPEIRKCKDELYDMPCKLQNVWHLQLSNV